MENKEKETTIFDDLKAIGKEEIDKWVSPMKRKNDEESVMSIINEKTLKNLENSYELYLIFDKEKIKLWELNPKYSIEKVKKIWLEKFKKSDIIFEEALKRLVFNQLLMNKKWYNDLGLVFMQHFLQNPKAAKKYLKLEPHATNKKLKTLFFKINRRNKIVLADVTEKTEKVAELFLKNTIYDNIKPLLLQELIGKIGQTNADVFGEVFILFLRDWYKVEDIENAILHKSWIKDELSVAGKESLQEVFLEARFRMVTELVKK